MILGVDQKGPEAIQVVNFTLQQDYFDLGCDDGEKLQDDLNKLFQWSCIWGMEFKAKKCKVFKGGSYKIN